MKNVTLSLLAAAAIGAISIGSVYAMPVNNLAGLGESHFQDVGSAAATWSPAALAQQAEQVRPAVTIGGNWVRVKFGKFLSRPRARDLRS